jgi:predicted GNAT family N-acyltransferase
MKIIVHDKIPTESRYIRETVFLKEQGFPKEYDENDNIAKHIVIYENDEAIATCRVYWDKDVNCYHIGRIAVLKPHRGKGLGITIVKEAEKLIKEQGGTEVFISGQVRVAEFYINKLGYTKYGEEYLEEEKPHVALKKSLI